MDIRPVHVASLVGEQKPHRRDRVLHLADVAGGDALATICKVAYPNFMPVLSRFFGIVIGIFYREHGRPHFHAVYGEFEAMLDIETGAVMSGQLPGRALTLVREWQELHKSELQDDWELARQHQPLKKIAPLE